MSSANQQTGSAGGGADRFATTHWSVVVAAGEGNERSAEALEALCRAYWPPLYAYVRRRVDCIHDAQDLTQAFFATLLEKRYLGQADRRKGRFRAFLITAFKHFLSKEWAKAKARKRGGGVTTLSFDFAAQDALLAHPAEELTADRLYERQWAVTLLNRVMSRLQREMERGGKGGQFHCLKRFIVGGERSSYAEAAAELGQSESAARMAASRLRQRYRDLLRDEIAQTVASPEEIEDELRHLFGAFEN